MPRKPILTKEDIIKAAFAIVSESGKEALTARSLAERLQCSPHPILNQFESMAEIQEEVRLKAFAMYGEYIEKGASSTRPLLNSTYEAIWFALNEPNLFKFAFLDEHKRLNVKDYLDRIHKKDQLLEIFTEHFGFSEKEAYEFFKTMNLAIFGVLGLMANDIIHISLDDLNAYIKAIWSGLYSHYLVKKGEDINAIPNQAIWAANKPHEIVNHIHRRIIQSDFIQGLQDDPHFLQDHEWYKIERLLSASYGLTRHALLSRCPTLSGSDRRLIYLLMLGFKNQHIATLIGIAQSSVAKAKQRLKLKTGSSNLEDFINSI